MGNCIITRRNFDQGGNPPVSIVSWQNGTDAEIKAMIAAADAGQINLTDYWSVGDSRNVLLSAISKDANKGFVYDMDAQTIVLILMNIGYMSQSVNFVVGQKDCLNQFCKLNSTQTNEGSWGSTQLRTGLNDLYYSALPYLFRIILKTFDVKTAASYNGSTIQTVQDKVALFAEREINVSTTYSNSYERNALNGISYYNSSSRRLKYKGYGSTIMASWALRSPYYNNNTSFCRILNSGDHLSSYDNADGIQGTSPFMCI